MALYNFQRRFAPKVESGEKTHTIRSKRKRATRVGETLYLHTGLRQPGARKLLEAVCTKVEDIMIRRLDRSANSPVLVLVNGEMLSRDERETLAVRDGFDDFAWMVLFWKDRLPFHGDIIHWKFPKGGR